jgi:hypothetical protein
LIIGSGKVDSQSRLFEASDQGNGCSSTVESVRLSEMVSGEYAAILSGRTISSTKVNRHLGIGTIGKTLKGESCPRLFQLRIYEEDYLLVFWNHTIRE